MTSCQVDQIIQAHPMAEGAGVVVHRTIGTAERRHLDPFLMLDHFGSDNPDEYIAGFPDHPHRGFITLTYMLDGRMLHEDSMGNRGDLKAGGVQWMKAGSGVIHSEMPQQTNGLMRGFQLWINLPAAQKMTAPGYQEYSADAIPCVRAGNASVKIIAGQIGETRGPIEDPNTDVFYYDIDLQTPEVLELPVPLTHQSFVYCYEGEASLLGDSGADAIPTHSLTVLTQGDSIKLVSTAESTRLIFVGGKPIDEEIVQYGPFVMNSRAEIERALADYHHGKLVQEKAVFVTDT
ncbi:MAG: pirin family protein [Gammaproteobacteria bacterium]